MPSLNSFHIVHIFGKSIFFRNSTQINLKQKYKNDALNKKQSEFNIIIDTNPQIRNNIIELYHIARSAWFTKSFFEITSYWVLSICITN